MKPKTKLSPRPAPKLKIKTLVFIASAFAFAAVVLFGMMLYYGTFGSSSEGNAANDSSNDQIASSYLISSFDWETAPDLPDAGPAVISMSNSAYVSMSGISGKGLNAGTPEHKINMKLPGSYFDVDGIDVRIYFQRDENSGELFRRGNSLRFRMNNGKLKIRYRVEDGNGGFIQITQSNLYTIPNDDVLREYRFVYDPNSGIGEVFVDGNSVWSHAGTPGRVMYWNNAGNMIIGKDMDGEGENKVVFDNLRIYAVPLAPLPIELVDFSARLIDNSVELNWITASESNNDYYSIERSSDGMLFESIATIAGAGNSNASLNYRYFDENPLKGISYYRLKQTDFDGKSTESKIVVIDNATHKAAVTDMSVFPNPARMHLPLNVKIFSHLKRLVEIKIVDLSGKIVYKKELLLNEGDNQYQLSTNQINDNGVYLIRLIDQDMVKTKKIMFIY